MPFSALVEVYWTRKTQVINIRWRNISSGETWELENAAAELENNFTEPENGLLVI